MTSCEQDQLSFVCVCVCRSIDICLYMFMVCVCGCLYMLKVFECACASWGGCLVWGCMLHVADVVFLGLGLKRVESCQ